MLQAHWAKITLIAIVVLAAALRLPFLGQYPPQMHQDEASIAYNAWSIATTGKDEWGVPWPSTFAAFGDAKLPVMIYVSAAVMKVVGFDPLVPRYVSAIAGIASVVLTMLWLEKATGKKDLAMFGGLVMAVSSGIVHLSRLGLESNLALSLFVLGLWASSHLTDQKSSPRNFYLITFILAWGLSTWTYIAFRLVVPLLAILLWITNQTRTKKYLLLGGIGIALMMLPQIIGGSSLTRLHQIGSLQPTKINSEVIELRNACHLWAENWQWWRWGCRALWNPVSVTGHILLRDTLEHLNPTFWFWRGDLELWRNPLRFGFFSIFLLPLFLVGMNNQTKVSWRNIALAMLAIALIPSILTGETNFYRLTPALPFMIYFVAAGFTKVPKIGQLALLTALLFVTMRHVWLYPPSLFVHARAGYAYAPAIIDHARHESDAQTSVWFDRVIDEPHIFLATYLPIEPSTYHTIDKTAARDELGFERPTQIGPAWQFPSIHTKSLPLVDFCKGEENTDIVLITIDPAMAVFEPAWTIKTRDGVHTIAHAYRRSTIQADPDWSGLCLPPASK